jgi:GDPmannose 4,6-dehydratase
MWLMLQQKEPQDFVIATGKTRSVREFCERAFHRAEIAIEWRGQGLEERGIDRATGRVLVEVDPRYLRPTEVDALLGDPGKARMKLGWRASTTFELLVELMVDADLRLAEDEAHLAGRNVKKRPYGDDARTR